VKFSDLWIVNVKLLPRPPRIINTWPGPFGQFVYLLCRVNYDRALARAVGISNDYDYDYDYTHKNKYKYKYKYEYDCKYNYELFCTQ